MSSQGLAAGFVHKSSIVVTAKGIVGSPRRQLVVTSHRVDRASVVDYWAPVLWLYLSLWGSPLLRGYPSQMSKLLGFPIHGGLTSVCAIASCFQAKLFLRAGCLTGHRARAITPARTTLRFLSFYRLLASVHPLEYMPFSWYSTSYSRMYKISAQATIS